ncbi:MAG: ankyrin repeat domain-containing protein [Deinococcales bacterium]
MRRLSLALTLTMLALALPGMADALDAHGIAPALEQAFPPSVAYLDCPFKSSARTCVLLPDATSVKSGSRIALAFLRRQPGVSSIEQQGATAGYRFRAGDTAYRLVVAASRARRGMIAATLSFDFPSGTAAHPVCLHPNALFDLARLPTLSATEYTSMATAITCHGPDPVDAQGRTPLAYAAASGNLAAIRTLLRGGADPNHIDNAGWTPMLVAARSGTRTILDALLQAGGDPTYIAPDGATAAALEPFNSHLDDSARQRPGAAILPDGVGVVNAPYRAGLPIPAPDGANLAVPAATAAAPGAASTSASDGVAATRGAPSAAQATAAEAAPKATAKASTTTADTATPALGAPAHGTPAEEASSVAATPAARARTPSATGNRAIGPAGRRPSTTFAMLALAIVLGVGLALTIVRLRRRAPARHPRFLNDASTSLQAVPQPRPLRRGTRHHSLEPVPRWNDPPA